MIYSLLGVFGAGKRSREAAEASETVAATISRLEILADHLETTAEALEELVQRLRDEEEVSG